jgi:hypothetical protein
MNHMVVSHLQRPEWTNGVTVKAFEKSHLHEISIPLERVLPDPPFPRSNQLLGFTKTGQGATDE